MITDAIIGALHSVVVFFVGLLPDAPERPQWVDGMFNILQTVDYLLPASEIFTFMTYVGVVYGAFLVWRLVRFLWIGGG